MSATNAFETALLALIFTNTNAANVGDATGLRGSTTAGSFYVSMHTASPGETGNQTTNETAYSSYGRVAVTRSTADWTVTNDTADNDNAITFPTCGVTGATLTDFGIGSDSSGSGNLFIYGALTASLVVSNGIVPSFAAGALDVQLN